MQYTLYHVICLHLIHKPDCQTVKLLLINGDKLKIKPEGVWHIHSNPFDVTSLTYWHFEGDIRNIIDAIKKGAE